jgi:hypothetical protein
MSAINFGMNFVEPFELSSNMEKRDSNMNNKN